MMSQLQYGLQLCNSVRSNVPDTQGGNMKAAQTAQNKMLRMIYNASLKDHIRSADLLKKYRLLSVNQLATQIKLVESWKAINLTDYPIKLEDNQLQRNTNGRAVRQTNKRVYYYFQTSVHFLFNGGVFSGYPSLPAFHLSRPPYF